MKILYQLLIISLLPLIILLSINYYQSNIIKEVDEKNTKNNLVNIKKNLLELIYIKNQQYKQFSKLIKTNELINYIETRDNNELHTIAQKYINSRLFSKIVFIDKDGFVILRGKDEYKFNDNIKDDILKNIIKNKEEFNGLIYFDEKYHLVNISPIFKFDVEFMGYVILGETIDTRFLDSLNINDYFLQINFSQKENSVNNFTKKYKTNKESYINYEFDLNYKRLYNVDSAPRITIYKNYHQDTLVENSFFTLNNIIIAMLAILPIIVWYYIYKTILPLNNLTNTLTRFMYNKSPLFDTIDELKKIKSTNKETKSLIIAILSSLDKLYKSQNDLIDEKQKSQESDKLKGDFLSNITTQINRPLNSIMNFGDILLKTSLDKVQLNYLNTIIKSSYSLQSAFNDIVDLSNISYGTLNLNIKASKIGEIVDELKTFYMVDMENKALRLDILIDSFDKEHTLKIDRAILKKTLIKIIDNALKYTFAGSIKIVFEVIRVDYGKNQVDFNISIIDTGIGINNRDKHRIINSFNQSHILYDKKHGPFGLGLSIVNKFVKLMKGNIKIKSEVSKGTNFTLSFENIEFEKTTSIDKESIQRKKSIIIADSDSKNRVYIQKYFSKNFPDIEVQKTSNGYDTIKQCFNEKDYPVLIIINLNLRAIDAIKVLEYIRSNNHTNLINIIVIKDKDTDIKKLLKFKLIDTLEEPLKKDGLESIFRKLNALLN